MSITRNLIASTAAAAVLSSGTLAATPTIYTQSDLDSHLRQIAQGTRTTLEEGLYVVRRELLYNINNWERINNALQPVKIKGKTTTNSEGEVLYKTNIVLGVPVPKFHNSTRKWKLWSELPTSDPWKDKFQTSARSNIYWLDINHDLVNWYLPSTTHDDYQPTSEPLWVTGWERSGASGAVFQHKGWALNDEYNGPLSAVAKPWQKPLTVTVNGIPLRYADMRDPIGGGAWRYARAMAGGDVDWIKNDVVGGMGQNSPQVSWAHYDDETLVTSFPFADFRSVTNRVSHVEQYSQEEGDPQQTYEDLFLSANPFASSTGGVSIPYPVTVGSTTYPTGTSTKAMGGFTLRQRFKIWNSPSFLTQPGTMVLNTALKRLYFIPPGVAAGEDMTSYGNTNSSTPKRGPESSIPEDSQFLEISLPRYNSANSTALAAVGIKVDAKDTTGTIPGVEIQNVRIGTALSQGVEIKNSVSTEISNTFFRNLGSEGVKLYHSPNSLIHNNTFRGGYRSMLVVQNGKAWWPSVLGNQLKDVFARDFASVANNANMPVEADSNLKNLYPNDISILENEFEDGGLVYPEAPAIVLSGMPVGTLISGNAFSRLPGPAILMAGMKTIVAENTFTDVCQDISDSGAVYAGRSWTQIGQYVLDNTFVRTKRVTPLASDSSVYTNTTASVLDHWKNACIYFDDGQFGAVATGNIGSFSDYLVHVNRGAWIVLNNPSSASIPVKHYVTDQNSLGGGDLAYYQNYRELGLFFGDPNFSYNSYWDEIFSYIDEAYTTFGGSLPSGGMKSWMEDLRSQTSAAGTTLGIQPVWRQNFFPKSALKSLSTSVITDSPSWQFKNRYILQN